MDDTRDFEERRAAFQPAKRTLVELLEDEGFSVIPHEVQEWAADLHLTRRDLDGSLSFLIGPLRRRPDDERLAAPYLIQWEESELSEVIVPEPANDSVVARLLLGALTGFLNRGEIKPRPIDVGVGVGLQSTDAGELDAAGRERRANPPTAASPGSSV